jgi:GT2 family glycosyltransferase
VAAHLSVIERNADVVFGRSTAHWMTAQPRWFSPLHYGRFALLDYGDRPVVIRSMETQFFGLNFSTTRRAVEALDGFDETLGYRKGGGAAGEDTDFCQRALAAGMTVVYTPDAKVQHVIPAARATKQFYRHRLASAADRDYEKLRDSFPNVPWTLGVPRFMLRTAAQDALRFVTSTISLAPDRAFDYELKVRRVAGYIRAAARRRQAPAGVQTS